MSNIQLLNEDNMAVMDRYPDGYFDLAIVDPEYGIGASKPSKKPNKAIQKNGNVLNVKSPVYKHKDWDNKPAGSEYFNELKRVSKHQIIWGVNHYDYVFGVGRIVWDKINGDSDQFGCEIAYCSLNNRTDIVHYLWSGMFQGEYCGTDIRKAIVQIGNKQLNEPRIHPTQKPVKLYDWIYHNYTQPTFKILDTHLGSFSNAISANKFGVSEFVGCEIDLDIFNDGKKRFNLVTSQKNLFAA